ncbi:hypothetical protein ONZ45_g7631 [Pleurotus djamor]|nr:hypothetical protein ONZ45_g7631 [Pleurotus djamor]
MGGSEEDIPEFELSQPFETEDLAEYRPGGYHPVHFGDIFRDGRYTVHHKLGYGISATVWLVKDTLKDSYASLKILTAEYTANNQELSVLLHLREEEGSGKENIVQLIDHFQHTGPNGTHQCIVTELLGPPLSTDIEVVYVTEILPPSVAKRLIAQVALGVSFLHKRNIVHGDMHLSNLLFYSDKLVDALKKEGVEAVYGAPRTDPLILLDRKDREHPAPPSPHAPAYSVVTPYSEFLVHLCLDDPSQTSLRIADFSESYILDPQTQPLPLHAPDMYRPPEGLIPSIHESKVFSSHATDIWNLAVLFHVLFSGGCGLFACGLELWRPSQYEDVILCEMVSVLGRLPEPLWLRWSGRQKYFNDQGTWIGPVQSAPSGRFLRLFKGTMDDIEEKAFETMLRGMVRYEGERRMTIDDVLNSEWFVKYCTPDVSVYRKPD